MTNPETAINTILATEKTIEDVTIHPITLARYALLELIESPFVTPGKKFTINNLVPSFFICCAKSEDLKGINSKNLDVLNQRSMEWAETLPNTVIDKLIPEIMEALGIIKKVSPNTGDDEQGKEKGL